MVLRIGFGVNPVVLCYHTPHVLSAVGLAASLALYSSQTSPAFGNRIVSLSKVGLPLFISLVGSYLLQRKLPTYCEELFVHSMQKNGAWVLNLSTTSAWLIPYLAHAGVDLNMRDRHGDTLLNFAAAAKAIDLVEALLFYGANPGVSNSAGKTALELAFDEDCPQIVELLLRAGASFQSSFAEDIFHWAVARGFHTLASFFLDEGRVDIDCRDSEGDTPLLSALVMGQEEVARSLIEAGANLTATNSDEMPLTLAVKNGHEGIAQIIVAAMSESDKLIELQWELIHGHIEVIKFLVTMGNVDLEVPDPRGNTLLIHCAAHNYEEGVRSLIVVGANLNAQNHSGHTALYCALACGHKQIVIQLLEAGATLVGIDKEMLFFWAVINDQLEIVRRLAREGDVNVDAFDSAGYTPLMIAALNDSEVVVRALHHAGADHTIRGKWGTAAEIAERSHSTVAARVLRSLTKV